MFKEKLLALIRGAFPLIQINTNEYDRATLEVIRALFSMPEQNPEINIFIAGKGVRVLHFNEPIDDWNSEEATYIANTSDIEQALRYLLTKKKNTVLIVRNLDLYLQDIFRRPRLIDTLYLIYETGLSDRIFVIDFSTSPVPSELKNYFISIDFPLPSEEEITSIVQEFIDSYGVKINKKNLSVLVSLLKGMSKAEIEGALAISLVMKNEIDLSIIRSEKAQMVLKTGLLEWIEDIPSIDDIGGLDNLKQWFQKVAFVFLNRKEAQDYGIKIPKGCLLTGVPGTGKTLSAKAIASLLNVPLFRLDISRLYGSLVGETERNVRETLKLIDALSPCVVLIDEIEKALSGIHSSSFSDSGVTSRLFGSLLYYMQEKKTFSFFVCTANDIYLLPPEFLRKGRFDEIWYVGLPTSVERKCIWEIHLSKTGRNSENFDISKLVEATKGFTGAEIENVIQETLYHCFYEQREPTTEDFLVFIKNITPLSVLEREKIKALEEWAKTSRIRKANSAVSTSKKVKKNSRLILN